jgi:hypothetical protein
MREPEKECGILRLKEWQRQEFHVERAPEYLLFRLFHVKHPQAIHSFRTDCSGLFHRIPV